MKAYFACSIRSGGDTSNYLPILDTLKSLGIDVLSEIFVHDAINFGGSPLPVGEIYQRDTNMIKACDFVIAEVTHPSLGVGYELAYAEKLNRPILCMFDEKSDKSLSAMISGNPYNSVATYNMATLNEIVKSFLIESNLNQTLQKRTDR